MWQVWDLIKLADYLTKRDDIDPCRIGIAGISLGGLFGLVERNISDPLPCVNHSSFNLNSSVQECMHGLQHLQTPAMLWLSQ